MRLNLRKYPGEGTRGYIFKVLMFIPWERWSLTGTFVRLIEINLAYLTNDIPKIGGELINHICKIPVFTFYFESSGAGRRPALPENIFL